MGFKDKQETLWDMAYLEYERERGESFLGARPPPPTSGLMSSLETMLVITERGGLHLHPELRLNWGGGADGEGESSYF